MDAVLFTGIAIFLTLISLSKPDTADNSSNKIVEEDTTRIAKLNDAFYEDPNAFLEIAHALGFPKGV